VLFIRNSPIVLLVLSFLAFCEEGSVPSNASAGMFVDLYGGAALPEQQLATHNQIQPAEGAQLRSLDFWTGHELGARAGYWFKTYPWFGVAADVSYFKRQAAGANITVGPLSALLLFRWAMLVSDEFPNGRLYPYVGGGPSLVIGKSSIDVNPLAKTQDTNITDLGADARAGFVWKFHKYFGLFTEYRFTYVSYATADLVCPSLPQDCGLAQSRRITLRKTETELMTHHVLVGVRFELP
jgi:opacity protein-like surface antigen